MAEKVFKNMKATKTQVAWQGLLIGAISILLVAGLFSGVGSDVLENIKDEEQATTVVATGNESWTGTTTRTALTNDCIDTTAANIVVTNDTGAGSETDYILVAANYTISLDEDGNSWIQLATTEYDGLPLNISYSYREDSWCVMQYSQGGIGNLTSLLGLLGTIITLGAIVTVISVFLFRRFR